MVKLPSEVVDWLGQAKETVFLLRGIVHRVAGAGMILVSFYHILYLLLSRAGRRWLSDMLPRPKDLKEAFYNAMYLIRINDTPPEFDRFSYKHKVEYWALISGSIIMSVTGLLLWTQDLWNKFLVDIATLVHGMEAILAALAILVWHMYEIHLRPGRKLTDDHWLTGIVEEEEMKEEHALHYRKIMSDPALREIYIARDK
jgi:cytochrome b subunit of formate dehydrogenase